MSNNKSKFSIKNRGIRIKIGSFIKSIIKRNTGEQKQGTIIRCTLLLTFQSLSHIHPIHWVFPDKTEGVLIPHD